MARQRIEELTIKFESDTLITVSPETAQRLVEIMESNSIEALIQLLLRNLAAETAVIPTSRLILYPLTGKYLPGRGW